MRSVLSLFLTFLLTLNLGAQTSSQKIKRLEKQRNDLLKKIDQTNKALQQVQRDSKEESKRLNLIKQQVAQRKEVIAIIGQEMQALEGRIDSLGGRIATLRSRESRLMSEYARSLRALYRSEAEAQRLLYLFSAKSIEDLRLRQHYLSKYARAAKTVVKDLQSTRQDIEETQAETNRLHQQKAQVLDLRERERQALETEQGQRSANINKLKGKEQQLAQDLSKHKRQAEQLDAQIQAQIAAEIAAAEAKAQRAAEAKRRRQEARRRAQARVQHNKNKGTRPSTTKEPDKTPAEDDKPSPNEANEAEGNERRAEERGGYAMDATERKLSGSFAQNKGRLPMPVRGAYTVVRRFGTQQHEEHSRIHVVNGGIDLRVKSDRSAYAVFEGVVTRIFVTPGFGQSVIVRHGNYLTVYANLSSVRVKSGQRVTTGTALGTISSDDSNGRGNVLHFQLWHERRKQNPEAWIRR